MIVSEYIAKFLKNDSITTIFGYQGGNISITIDAIVREGLNFVETYNEQGASFAANAFAEITGSYGVAISSSGPGAINMLNGIANAYYDGIPCLFITGDVNTNFRNKYPNVRQSEFQEVDIISMCRPVVKKTYQVETADEIPSVLQDAKKIMFEGRKGPVLINLAHNIQKAYIEDIDRQITLAVKNNRIAGSENVIREKLNAAKNPVVLIGNGCNDNKKQIKDWLDLAQLPFTSTLKALDFYPDSQNYLGFAGNYGSVTAKVALNQADTILVLGVRLDVRVISAIENFSDKVILHVDIDEGELLKHDSKEYIRFNCNLSELDFAKIVYSKPSVLNVKKDDNSFETLSFKSFFSSFYWNGRATYLLDVGLHQMAAARYLNLKNGDRILSSGGLGSMGYSLPAAIGSYYADKESSSIVISGDGGIQMNLQELEIIRRERLPIKVFVLNNGCLGMIRNYQDFALGSRYYATVEGFSSPSYSQLAKTFEMGYFKIDEYDDIERVLKRVQSIDMPCMVEVKIPVNDNID